MSTRVRLRNVSPLACSLDASTLRVTAFSVGMPQANSFSSQSQDAKVAMLAGFVEEWLDDGLAVVGIDEIHSSIAQKLEQALAPKFNVGIYSDSTNSLLWRLPQ